MCDKSWSGHYDCLKATVDHHDYSIQCRFFTNTVIYWAKTFHCNRDRSTKRWINETCAQVLSCYLHDLNIEYCVCLWQEHMAGVYVLLEKLIPHNASKALKPGGWMYIPFWISRVGSKRIRFWFVLQNTISISDSFFSPYEMNVFMGIQTGHTFELRWGMLPRN